MVNHRVIISNSMLVGACLYGFVSGAVSGKMYATVGLVLYTASGVLVIAAECVSNNRTIVQCKNHAHHLAMIAGIDFLTTDVCIAFGVDDKLALLNLVPPAIDLLMYYAIDSSWDPLTQYTHIVSIVLHALFGIRDSKYILCVSSVAFLLAIFGSWDYRYSYSQIFNAIGVFSTEWFLAGKDIQELNPLN